MSLTVPKIFVKQARRLSGSQNEDSIRCQIDRERGGDEKSNGVLQGGDSAGLKALIIQSEFTPPRNLCEFSHLPPLRREPIDQRQPVKAFPESSREIVDPALASQSAPLPDLLHRHAKNQDLMHQGGAVGA
jgi:hypothetical protein